MKIFSISARRVALFALTGMPVALIIGETLPTYAANTTTVSSAVSSFLGTISTNGTVSLPLNASGGSVQTIQSDTLSVSTNDSLGYTAKVSGATATLVSGSNTIPAITGTQAAPAVETAGSWGYRVDGVGGFGAGPTSAATNAAISGAIKFAPMPTSTPDTIKTTATTASSDTTTVWYGAAVAATQASGTYTDAITYTVTAN